MMNDAIELFEKSCTPAVLKFIKPPCCLDVSSILIQSLRGVTLLMTSGTLKISSMFHYRALIITETALATMVPHHGTVYHVI